MERELFCDGGARPTNPGPGGFAWIEISNDKVINYHSEYFENVTNNRMELAAMLDVLKFIDGTEDKCFIYCDSSYVVNICNTWARGWEFAGWTRSGEKSIENLDLVKEVYKYYNKNIWNVQILKIKGHCGNTANDLVDALTWSEEKFRELAKKKNIEIL